jgi:hypothetical protein
MTSLISVTIMNSGALKFHFFKQYNRSLFRNLIAKICKSAYFKWTVSHPDSSC